MSHHLLRPLFRIALSILILNSASAFAATTEAVRHDSFADFKDGKLEGVALSSDGFLYPSLKMQSVGDTGETIVWDAIDLPNGGGVLCATGHDGKLIRISPEGLALTLGDLHDPEITALEAAPDGGAYVASAPSGKLYHLSADDDLTTLTTLDAKFVWDMEVDAEGTLWAATGADGKLFKVSVDGADTTATLAHEFKSKNLLDLWIDTEGTMGKSGAIYVAGQAPSWLYRYDPVEDTAEVIYDAESDEIRAIAEVDDGLIIAVNATRAPTSQALSMTLRMSGARVDPSKSGGSSSAAAKAREKAMGDVFADAKPEGQAGPSSHVIHVSPSGFVRTLWDSPERPIHSIAASSDGPLLVSAGGKGRLFQLHDDGQFSVVAQLRDDYLTRVVPNQNGWALTGARNGTVTQLFRDRAEDATFISAVIDAKSQVRWGRFYLRGLPNNAATVSFRTGNTSDPDEGGWSDWTTEKKLTSDGIESPQRASRYFQYRLELKSGNGKARADFAEMFYRAPNRKPELKAIAVAEGPTRGSSGEKSEDSKPESAGGRKPNSNPQSLVLKWAAADPNGDDLLYEVYYKSTDEKNWKLIDDEIRATQLPLGVGMVGSGRFRFKVVATDRLENPPGAGLKDQIISELVTIDNEAPRITELKVEPGSKVVSVRFTVTDDLSFISSVLVDLDNGDTYPLHPADGFWDETEEFVEWKSEKLKPGEHVLTINATDREGNSSTRRAVFTVDK